MCSTGAAVERQLGSSLAAAAAAAAAVWQPRRSLAALQQQINSKPAEQPPRIGPPN